MSNRVPLISVVTPVYNEAACLAHYADTVRTVLLSQQHVRFEFILVDDGSSDESWQLIERLVDADRRFRGLRLSRNFGAHAALSAGLNLADGDAVATLAADLQDPPQTILRFITAWQDGAQIVWGRRASRDDAPARALVSAVFARLLKRYAMPAGSQFTTGSFFLIDKRVVQCYREFPERNRVTFALVAWTGFRQASVLYDRPARIAGQSGWSLGRMFKAMYDTFIGFSEAPARLMTVAGVVVSSLTVPFSIYLVLDWWLTDSVPGWTGLMVGMTVFFGLQFLMMGLVGEYLYRIYSEVTRRPLYFVSEDTASEAASRG